MKLRHRYFLRNFFRSDSIFELIPMPAIAALGFFIVPGQEDKYSMLRLLAASLIFIAVFYIFKRIKHDIRADMSFVNALDIVFRYIAKAGWSGALLSLLICARNGNIGVTIAAVIAGIICVLMTFGFFYVNLGKF